MTFTARHLLNALPGLLLPVLLTMFAGNVSAYDRSIGVGMSYGESLGEDSDFWGLTIDYAFLLQSGWTMTTALAWDEETERKDNRPEKVVRSYTPTISWAHPISPRWSLAAGFGKGIYNDDNDEGEFKWVDWDKEWAIGGVATFQLFHHDRHSVNVATSLEYDLSDGAPQISVDLAYSWGF